MSDTNITKQPEISEELQLLRTIAKKVDGIDASMDNMKKQAAAYGAAAGGVSGAIAAVGVMIAKAKLGF
ncbi:hypothetical protein FHW83_004720 [Duganella sp. SG902]|uniref:hypothetical protein n=1 Tax=unclassified Duganella TaxID=2636909 RepID=UPI0013682D97|nr:MULTISPECIES: hypothetical protein [unclassified Duganella]MYM32249.1 hypothetical protein [Duganella sp. CY15W]NVM78889.1 hypothetical protein [Duganella sp. SG902]